MELGLTEDQWYLPPYTLDPWCTWDGVGTHRRSMVLAPLHTRSVVHMGRSWDSRKISCTSPPAHSIRGAHGKELGLTEDQLYLPPCTLDPWCTWDGVGTHGRSMVLAPLYTRSVVHMGWSWDSRKISCTCLPIH